MKGKRPIISWILCILVAVFAMQIKAQTRSSLDLSGEWTYRLKGAPSSIPGEGSLILPGTLDEQHKSIYHPASDNTSQLRREYSFEGEAIFSRDIIIPDSWKDKEIFLFLERTKPSTISVDGIKSFTDSKISSPQVYKLSDRLSPGKHTLEISVNNADSIPPIIRHTSHATSETTQTNWNGILGDLRLEARNKFHIERLEIIDSLDPNDTSLKVNFSGPSPSNMLLTLKGNNTEIIMPINKGDTDLMISYPVSPEELWSANNPFLHTIEIDVTEKDGQKIDDYSISTGFRKFSTSERQFLINGYPVFLRGTINAAVFPKNAYAPTDEKSWSDYFATLKSFGINHVRFHSWTPPEAALAAADQLGMYLLLELPLWGEMDRDLHFQNKFLEEDLMGIMNSYAHHPSFVMFSPGNELWGDLTLMAEYKNKAKKLNPRILSTYGSNVYLGMNGQISDEDFIISAKTSGDSQSQVRGSNSFIERFDGGLLNSQYPNSEFNYENSLTNITVPLISHEVGQYQSYPDFSQISKYTGILLPDNLKEFEKRAQEAGIADRSPLFSEASSKWTAQLYRAELEAALRTKGVAGIEMMGIQDYPGQGSAFVGMLDSFLDAKTGVNPEEWSQVFNDVTVLAKFPKFSFQSGEEVNIPLIQVNYTTNPDTLNIIKWETDFAKGQLEGLSDIGRHDYGKVVFKVPETKKPLQSNLYLKDINNRILSKYDFFIFPKEPGKKNKIEVTGDLKEALALLDLGKKVILFTDSAAVASTSLNPLFVTDFWNYQIYHKLSNEMHAPDSPGTLGLSIDANHKALKNFPTGNHTNWQWYPIIKYSRPLIIDRLPKSVKPIVEVIDNIDRSYRLSLLLECNVGKGKLMIVSSDLNKAMEYPETQWLLNSLSEYMTTKDFKPNLTLTPTQLATLLNKPSVDRIIRETNDPLLN